MTPPAISIWRVEAFSLSTIVVSEAATIIVNATISEPAVIEKIRKTNSPVMIPLVILAVSSPIITGATHPVSYTHLTLPTNREV